MKKIICLLFSCLILYQNAKSQVYCTSSLGGGGCQSYSRIDGFSIIGTSLDVNGNYCHTSLGNALTVFPDTGMATCTLSVGQTYSVKLSRPCWCCAIACEGLSLASNFGILKSCADGF